MLAICVARGSEHASNSNCTSVNCVVANANKIAAERNAGRTHMEGDLVTLFLSICGPQESIEQQQRGHSLM